MGEVFPFLRYLFYYVSFYLKREKNLVLNFHCQKLAPKSRFLKSGFQYRPRRSNTFLAWLSEQHKKVVKRKEGDSLYW